MRLALAALLLVACAPEAPAPTTAPRVAPQLEDVVARHRAELGPGLTTPADPGAPDGPTLELVEAVLGALESNRADYRALALQDARGLAPAGVARLVEVLRDPARTPELRSATAEALGTLATPLALDALVSALEKAQEPWLRAQCGYWLGTSAQDVVLPRLALRLKYEKDYATAFWMADALARFGHLAGVEAMLNVWAGTSDETLRAQAATRLGELVAARGCVDAAELLRRWEEDDLPPPAQAFTPSPALLAEAWRWIGNLGEWNLRNVDDARFVLVRLEDWIVPLLCAALHERDVYVRQHALQVLERRGKRARGSLDALLDALEEARLAPAAAQALGALGDPAAAERLERELASPDPELCVAAARALGRLGATRAIAPLTTTFERAHARDLRQSAAVAWLALADDPRPRAFLLTCLADPAADAGEAELALEAWLRRAARAQPELAPVLEQWNAARDAGIPDEATLRARRATRAALLRALP